MCIRTEILTVEDYIHIYIYIYIYIYVLGGTAGGLSLMTL